MTRETFTAIVCIALVAIQMASIFVIEYEKTKGDVAQLAANLIAEAEAHDLLGPEKMARVVAQLRENIPPSFAGLLDEDTVRAIAQATYDAMHKYSVLKMK